MDRASYKTVRTNRGFVYNYYASAPDGTNNKPTLLFLHGFPSTSYDWRRQVEFFALKGFPVIVPDLLGYGGTDKPADAQFYAWGDMAADVIDILDAEKVENVIAIGHDWWVVMHGGNIRFPLTCLSCKGIRVDVSSGKSLWRAVPRLRVHGCRLLAFLCEIRL